MQRHLVACLTVIGLIAGVSALRADPIVLYNTGVDPLTGGVDSHYQLVAAPGNPALPAPLFVVPPGTFPMNGPWAADSLASSWIAPASNAPGSLWNNLPGTYTFETTFTLAGVNPSEVKINGIWGTDNEGVEIVLNGNVVAGPFATPGYPGFSAFNSPFTIDSGFQLGTNTLDFVVLNDAGAVGNPAGLRVEMSATTPEPATLSLLGLGLLGLGLQGRRRNFAR